MSGWGGAGRRVRVTVTGGAVWMVSVELASTRVSAVRYVSHRDHIEWRSTYKVIEY